MSDHETKARYAFFREESFAAALKELRDQATLVSVLKFANDETFKIAPLDITAVIHWKETYRETAFPWERLHAEYQNTMGRFETAIWFRGKVQAFALGKTSSGPEAVQIHYLERFGQDLKGFVVPIIITVADKYAKLRGKQNIKIRDPIPGVLPIYQDAGFELAPPDKKVTYYVRKVTS